MKIGIPFALACAALLAVGCIDPQDRRPGLWLSGEVVAGPVDDWSFTDGHPEIHLQVSTPYLIPHSITIVCSSDGANLYVGARDPDTKRWVKWVAANPDVRLGIGGKLYDRRLVPVDDEAQREAIYRAYSAKYRRGELVPRSERPRVQYYRVAERG